MKTLGGASFVHNGITQDYNYRETIECLAELCDKVVIVDAGSTDGTYEDMVNLIDKLNKEYDTSYTKIKLLRFTNEEWHEQVGREKLSYFSNKAIEALDTDWVFYLQMDEILHEDSFQYIRMAIEHDVQAYFCRRLNLWRDPWHMLNVPQERKPCSTEVIRLARTCYRCVDDAESLGVPEVMVFGDIDLIQIYHMGFVRDQVKHLEKIRHMQVEVFLWGDYDEKAKNCDRLIPERWFSDADLLPIPRPLPRFIQAWADERYPSTV
jgi:glycosyltransferase involved in cell wall biosynthesis